MDYKFLHRVIDQIVSETKLDYDKEIVNYPFTFYKSSLLHSFSSHCKNVYGLNKEEIDYVWSEYKRIIKDIIHIYK